MIDRETSMAKQADARMESKLLTPARLALRLSVYFAIALGSLLALAAYFPGAEQYLPVGGNDLQLPGTVEELAESLQGGGAGIWDERLDAALTVIASILGSIILIVPITWVYIAVKHQVGYQKAFVAALITLPICASSVVLLIQDSLALAFGLVALVGAVNFRVTLRDALDGTYIFAAICVGLASGIGYVGVGMVMTIAFCFASVILWNLGYGVNPIEEAKVAGKLAKLEQEQAHPGFGRDSETLPERGHDDR